MWLNSLISLNLSSTTWIIISGQTGTDSKRNSESPERREAALRLRYIPPAHHDPIHVPIHSAGSGLSSNAPMSEKDTDDALPRPGTGNSGLIPPSLGMEGSHRIHRLTTPSTFFQIGTPSCTPDRNEGGRGVSDINSRLAPTTSANAGHPVASELQRLLLAIHNEIKGCKAEIQGCRIEIRLCRDDISACVGEIKKINNRIDTFEKIESRYEAKFREIHEWIVRSEKEMNDRFKMYDERSNSVITACSGCCL